MKKNRPDVDVVRFERNGREVAFHLPQHDSDHIQRVIYEERGFYESELLGLIEGYVRPGDLVVDAGAHLGNHTVFFATQCDAQVLAFEPNPKIRALLEKQIALNGLDDQVTVRPAAVGVRGQGLLISPDNLNSGMTRVTRDDAGEVEIVALDDLQLPCAPRLVKIDVEGMELDVIRGARELLAAHHPLLAIECQTQRSFSEVFAALREYGYVVERVVQATPTALFMPRAEMGDSASVVGGLHYALHDVMHQLRGEILTVRNEHNAAVEQQTAATKRERETNERNHRVHELATEQVAGSVRRLEQTSGMEAASIERMSRQLDTLQAQLSTLDEKVESVNRRNRVLHARSVRELGKMDARQEAIQHDVRGIADWGRLGSGERVLDPWFRRVVRTLVIPIADGDAPLGRALQRWGRQAEDQPDDRSPWPVATLQRGLDAVLDRLTPAVGEERAAWYERMWYKFLADPEKFFADAGSPLLRRIATSQPLPKKRRALPDAGAPRSQALSETNFSRPKRAYILVAQHGEDIAIPVLRVLCKALPPDAELLLSIHATDPATLRSLLEVLAPVRARLFLHYQQLTLSEMVAYARDRTPAKSQLVLDATRAESLRIAALGRSPRLARITEPTTGLRANTRAHLGRRPLLFSPEREFDLVEYVIVRSARKESPAFDIFGAGAIGFVRRLDRNVIGELPLIDAFEVSPELGFFVARAPATEGICIETTPSWFDAAASRKLERRLVSVVMTVFNAEDTVASAIASILEQTHGNLELLVVDDCSTDRSFERVAEMAKHDGRIRLLRSPSNRGTYWCKNLGLTEAKGQMVTFQDSDDVSTACRLELQLAALHTFDKVIAVFGRYQRLDEHGRLVRMGRGSYSDRRAPITGMFRREDLWKQFGYFDSVRAGADDELIQRIAAAGGRVMTLPNTIYHARHVDGSLTTSGETAVVYLDGRPRSSRIRQQYWEHAEQWHRSIETGGVSPRMPFPLIRRPFKAPEPLLPLRGQEPAEGESVSASLATMPSRLEPLRLSVESLLPQVDRLNIFLNEFDQVPGFLQHPKIKVARSQDVEDLKDNGKFYFTEDLPAGYHFTVDDDIVYPADYVQRSILAIEAYGRRVAVGVHGVNLAEEVERFSKGREVFHFKEELVRDRVVHLLGTGTVAYHTSTLEAHLSQFRCTGVADLWFAILARDQGVPLIALQRPNQWLQPIEHEAENLFESNRRRDAELGDIARSHGPWRRNTVTKPAAELVHELLQQHSLLRVRAARVGLVECYRVAAQEPLSFKLIVPGWNCMEQVEGCIESILAQVSGPFEWEALMLDDGSTDDTWAVLVEKATDARIRLLRNHENKGPAHARMQLLDEVADPRAVCVLLDMDDELQPDALLRIAERFIENPACRLTLGNWRGTRVRLNPLGFHTRETYEAKTFCRLRKFRSPPPRAFRRELADGLQDWRFRGPDGKWLSYCTDLALMNPLMERCKPEEIEHIHKPIYIYYERRPSGTITRFGGGTKQEMHEWICLRKPPSE